MKDTVNTTFSLGSFFEFNQQNRLVINTINPISYVDSKEDNLLLISFVSSVLVTNSLLFSWVSKVLTGEKINRVSNLTIHSQLLKQANLSNQKIFYLGPSKKKLFRISRILNRNYPNITVSGYPTLHTYKFSKKETKKILTTINSFKPDILLVVPTIINQQKWVFRNKYQINAQMIVSIEDAFIAFDSKTKIKHYLSKKVQLLKKSIKNPKKIYNYISKIIRFLFEILKEKLFAKNYK